ncbi:MAG: hypothetical protein Q6373_012005 [Candidatus Sigynarchaeota archaeon]
MVRPNTERSEDTILALDCDPKNVEWKLIKKGIKKFFETKRAIDESDRFNLVLFRGNPSYLEDFTFKIEYLLSLIDEDPKSINAIPIENVIFMSLTFLIEVFKKVGQKFFRIIILTDQDTKPITKEFMVQDLLDITKEMPVYIDIIRLNVKQGDEDENEMKIRQIIKWSKGGELIYIPKPKKLFETVMAELAQKKFNEADIWEEEKEIKIPDKHAPFYENLAEDPKIIDNPGDMKCMACFKKVEDSNKLFKCSVCGNAVMHEKCWAFWSKTANIGVRNVYRCPICFSLQKLPREFIEEILGKVVEEEVKEAIETTQANVQVVDQLEVLKEKDSKTAPRLIESLLDSLA